MTADTTLDHHPAADAFPMLHDDELEALAADIAANGLHHPIVLDSDGRILDGRNRYAACRISGIEPDTVVFGGDDAAAFVISENIHRRHLNKGQQAIAYATVYAPDGRWQYGTRSAIDNSVDNLISRDWLSKAAALVGGAADLAEQVSAGTLSLGDAHKEMRTRDATTDTELARHDLLRQNHADLAEMVSDGALTLNEGIAAGNERDKDRADAARIYGKFLAASVHIGTLGRVASFATADLASALELGTITTTVEEIDATIDALTRISKELTG